MTKKYLEAVLILGKAAITDVITSDKKLIDNFAKNPSYKVIGSTENGFELADLELLKGKINHQTKIIIYAHGIIYNKEHMVQANRGLYTKEILQKLQSFSNSPLNIILESCFSGSAQYLVNHLHKGSVLVTTSKENSYSIFAFSLFEFENVENNQSNLFNDFLINMPKLASTYSKFITNKISFKLKPKYKHILDTELAREFLNKNADNFIKFAQENYSITLSKPQYTLDDINFFQKAFFIYSCALGESTFSEYLLKEQIQFKENYELINAKILNISALYLASERGHKEIVELLIVAGADVNQAIDDGVTPLHVASHQGYTEIVKLLIAAKADVNQANDNGDNPLHIASHQGYTEIVELLLKHKDINVNQPYEGHTAIDVACSLNHLEVAKALLAAGAYPNIDIPSTREYALLNKEIELFKNEPVKYILEHNINSNLVYKALNNLKHNELYNNNIIKLDKVIECFDNHANNDDLNLLEICGSNIDYTDEF